MDDLRWFQARVFVALAREPRLKPNEKNVLAYIASFLDQRRQDIILSYANIMNATGISQSSTLQVALRGLREAEVISWESGKWSRGSPFSKPEANEYVVFDPENWDLGMRGEKPNTGVTWAAERRKADRESRIEFELARMNHVASGK